MPPPDYIGSAWSDAQVFWATIGYLRAWWSTDGPNRVLIQRANGMNPTMLRSIAVEYNVNRLILRPDRSAQDAASDAGVPDDQSATRLCAILAGACGKWPADLPGRAQVCAGIAEKAKKAGVSTKNLASAATKFMWFLRPDEWTVYDRFAREGLGSPTRQNALGDMQAFYTMLHDHRFIALAGAMNAMIARTPFKGIPAERILDTILMGRGGRGAEDRRASHTAFLSLLPEATRVPLVALAAELQGRFGNSVLQPGDNRKGRA